MHKRDKLIVSFLQTLLKDMENSKRTLEEELQRSAEVAGAQSAFCWYLCTNWPGSPIIIPAFSVPKASAHYSESVLLLEVMDCGHADLQLSSLADE